MNDILKEIQINKTECIVYALNTDYEVFHKYKMSKDFHPGYNDLGQARCNAPDGVYIHGTYIDIDYPDRPDLTACFGWAYINITEDRGQALHGGGANLGWDEALKPFQAALLKTYGCFRMYNVDVFHLAHMVQRSRDMGIEVVIHVVS